MNGKRTITILGSTGSIGKQTLDVLDLQRDDFSVGFLTTNRNIDILQTQIDEYHPLGVVISDETACQEFKKNTSFKGEILCGSDGLIGVAGYSENDVVLNSLVGFSGALPTIAAINAGTDVALANKETLVSAGAVVMPLAHKKGVNIIAVDSEHSAILQSGVGEDKDSIEKLILTASGGPFFKMDKSEFKNITRAMALNHPNWNMGQKVTIDSATMMNKGFEVIEARWLFDVAPDKIDVLIHPQSIVHSLIEFIDGSIKAQLGAPDMKLPIAYALSYPGRIRTNFKRLNLAQIRDLTFFEPDLDKFPCLALAFKAIEKGGLFPAALNAANEIAVAAFLREAIAFTDIPKIIEKTLAKCANIDTPTIKDIIEIDRWARETAKAINN